jgi:hypothetical protein
MLPSCIAKSPWTRKMIFERSETSLISARDGQVIVEGWHQDSRTAPASSCCSANFPVHQSPGRLCNGQTLVILACGDD